MPELPILSTPAGQVGKGFRTPSAGDEREPADYPSTPLSQQTLSASFSDCLGPEFEQVGSTVDSSGPAPPEYRVYPALEGLPEKSTKFSLPGSGVPADRCGQRIPKHCGTHDGEFWGRSHCNERNCPRCYERWASMEAQSASLRISWGAKFWQNQRATVLARKVGGPLDPAWLTKDGRLLIGHFVISMPSDLSLWVHDWSPDKAKTMVYEVCKRHRVFGGAVIFHPWRRDEDFEYTPDGYWHFHVVGLHFIATSPGGTDFAADGSAVVFKHIRDDEYGNFGGLRSGVAVKRLLQYQLTHAGFREGDQALTYFGLLSPNRLPRSRTHESYPECLDEDSVTNPPVSATCPACGSTDIEPCVERVFDYEWYTPIEIEKHPPPAHEPTPDVVEQASVGLEERFQNLYDNEPRPAARHELTKERQRERMRLAGRELELFNMNDPLVAIWVWLKDALSEGPVPRDYLKAEDLGLLDKCVELNLKTGRLGITPGDRLYLKHEYDMDDALRDVRGIVLSGEPDTGRDWRLERLLKANPSEVNPILTDAGFVFGDALDRLIETNILGESSQPDRKIEGVWFKTVAGEIIGPGHFVEYLRKKMEEDGP